MIIYLKSINILSFKIIYPKIEKNYCDINKSLENFYSENFLSKQNISNTHNIYNITSRNKLELEYQINSSNSNKEIEGFETVIKKILKFKSILIL